MPEVSDFYPVDFLDSLNEAAKLREAIIFGLIDRAKLQPAGESRTRSVGLLGGFRRRQADAKLERSEHLLAGEAAAARTFNAEILDMTVGQIKRTFDELTAFSAFERRFWPSGTTRNAKWAKFMQLPADSPERYHRSEIHQQIDAVVNNHAHGGPDTARPTVPLRRKFPRVPNGISTFDQAAAAIADVSTAQTLSASTVDAMTFRDFMQAATLGLGDDVLQAYEHLLGDMELNAGPYKTALDGWRVIDIVETAARTKQIQPVLDLKAPLRGVLRSLIKEIDKSNNSNRPEVAQFAQDVISVLGSKAGIEAATKTPWLADLQTDLNKSLKRNHLSLAP